MREEWGSCGGGGGRRGAVVEVEDVGALGDSGSSLPGLIDAYPS